MNKREVLVDTAFLEKLSCDGKNIDNFKKVLAELEFSPVIHPYIAANELDMFPYFGELVEDGYMRVAEYSEFLCDETDKDFYKNVFIEIHDLMREYLAADNKKKQLDKLVLPHNQTIFTYRKASMSLGDVHIILMAFFMKMPIILTEDSDLALLRTIANRKFNSGSYTLQIYNAVGLLKMIAQKPKPTLSKNDLVNIAKSIGEREHQSEIKQIWNNSHEDT